MKDNMQRMYGDLVNGICYTAFFPFYLTMYTKDPTVEGARNITMAFGFTAIVSWLSWWKTSPVASAMALLGMSLSIAGMNLYQWPHADEVVVLPQFLWSLLIISGNMPLTLAYKTVMALIALTTALVVVVYTPLLVLGDALPLLLGATAVHVLFHYYKLISKQDLVSAHGASLVLAGTFCYHMSSEILTIINSPGYATKGGYSILKAGFIASVGLAAAGAFRREIDLKDALEVLVQERTKEIKKQAARLHMVSQALKASETAIAIVGSDQCILWSNAALERLSGKSESEIYGKSLCETLNPTDSGRGLLKSVFREHASAQDEIVANGCCLFVEISPFPSGGDYEEDHNGGSRFLVVLKDITVQRNHERAKKIAEREAVAVQAMKDSMQTLGHELRTPLQGILGLTSLLLEESENLPQDVAESLVTVMTSGRLLLTLINNMLDVRKCDAEMMEGFQLSATCLSTALQDATDFCKPFAKITEVGLELSLEAVEEVLVLSNALRFQQVMINLISNAVKYTAANSTVSVYAKVMTLDQANAIIGKSVASAPQTCSLDQVSKPSAIQVAVVTVSDQGAGIQSRTQTSRLFHQFAQLDTTPCNVIGKNTTVGQPSGTGLGLNLCVKFVQRMKGKLWVCNNQEGPGSCFSFYLPLVTDDGPVTLTHPLTSRGSGSSLASRTSGSIGSAVSSVRDVASQYRVLLVDDTIINLKVLGRILTRIGVGKVKMVDRGFKALEELEKGGDYNLVLTDVQMPGMTGPELSRAIRESNKIATKPIVVALTGEVSESGDELCRDSGMAHVLHKPVTAPQMQKFFDRVVYHLATPDLTKEN